MKVVCGAFLLYKYTHPSYATILCPFPQTDLIPYEVINNTIWKRSMGIVDWIIYLDLL